MPVAPDLSGTALEDRYELHELIGEGTFGRVYRGRDRRLDRPVAVKVVKPWWAEDPEWVAVFERETRMLARLSDPGIVQIHDVGHASEGLYYVSELVEGENLAGRLRRAGPEGVPVSEARAIAIGLCRALQAAHERNVVHRDVKPGNVLLGAGPQLRVKVGDFGIARLAEGTTPPVGGVGATGSHPSLVLGTPRYMAPEQARGERTSPATDVYSAGIVLYELLAGHTPFPAASPYALALSHVSQAPPALPDAIPEDLRAVVRRALAKDPGDRYPDAGAMAEALAAPGVNVPPPARDDDLTLPAPRRAPRTNVNPSARRRSVALLVFAGALLGALVAAALVIGHERSAARPGVGSAAPTVTVPRVAGDGLAQARRSLLAGGLRAKIRRVPGPAVSPGTVISQSPLPGNRLARRTAVLLLVAETPRWRSVQTFSGRTSAAFHIRGDQWRILSTVQSSRHCSLVVFCHGTSAHVLRYATGDSQVASVGLGDGTADVQVFHTDPGTYRVTVDPASGDTRWLISIQDDY